MNDRSNDVMISILVSVTDKLNGDEPPRFLTAIKVMDDATLCEKIYAAAFTAYFDSLARLQRNYDVSPNDPEYER